MASSQSRRRATPSRFPRTARVNEVLREVIATDLERQDDSRLDLVTVTAVESESDFKRAKVFFSALDTTADPAEVLEALEARRKPMQAAIARSIRLKNTPQLYFVADQGIIEGQKIEQILREMNEPKPESDD